MVEVDSFVPSQLLEFAQRRSKVGSPGASTLQPGDGTPNPSDADHRPISDRSSTRRHSNMSSLAASNRQDQTNCSG